MSFQKFLRIFRLNLFIFLVTLIELGRSSVQIPRLRGVSFARAPLYDAEKDFTCFDGSKTIPFKQVNDDYCDCSDGSDEPGTSACPMGSFYCTNAGHKPQILPSHRVNDGVCDCCDGTDEYANENDKCINNCLEVGKAAREEAARLIEMYKVGKQLRAQLSQEGQQMRNQKEQKLNELIKNKEEAERIKAEKEDIKNKAVEAENKALEYYRELEEQYKRKKAEQEIEKLREEAVENFKKLDINQDGLLDYIEIQSRQAFDRDRNGEVSEEEAKLFLGNQDSVDLNTFVETTWKLLKPFVIQEATRLYNKPPQDGNQEENEPEVQQDLEQEQAQQPPEDEEEDDEEEEEDENEGREQQEEEQEHIPYDEETQKLVDLANEARNEYSQSENSLRDINDQIRQIEESLKKDFGSDEEFASLEGQCFEFTDHEYVYRFCPFDKTVQIPKSSSMETSLGRWSKWDGPANNIYGSMMYDQGQNCWNGPNRSTKVKINCGSENKLLSVSEPNRCEYAFEFETPAACKGFGDQQGEKEVHDEL
ncbi:hypothetical protein ABEB36_013001 [Hypothenemus hampei]|uniref:Glucosidase 2 subunit beta n=1 Tax=Hypothenemus hampei TaxID=57062 RepID=A0ABD1E6S1_HYPHA